MKSSCLLAIFALCGQAYWTHAASDNIEKPVRYDGDQMWKVESNIHSLTTIVALSQLYGDLTIWSRTATEIEVFVPKSAVDPVGQRLKGENIKYEVFAADYQRVIDEENPPQEEIARVQRRNAHNLTWHAYHRLDDIYSYLDHLVEAYPELCSIETIGHSVEGRPLKVIKLSNGNASNRAFWLDGGIHAREWISPASVTYILNDLVLNWADQPAYIRHLNWYIMPVVNPDGYEYSHTTNRLWRKSRSNAANGKCAGVDLNRNFPFGMVSVGSSSDPCSDVYRGPAAFSEPETLAQKRFFDGTAERFGAFMSVHSFGQLFMYPWAHDPFIPTKDAQDLSRVGEEVAKSIHDVDGKDYEVGTPSKLLTAVSGTSLDWAKGMGIKYSYTIELRGYYGFVLPSKFIEPNAKEARAAAFVVAQNVAGITDAGEAPPSNTPKLRSVG